MRLRTFGGISVDGAPQALGGAATQRRPLALLALLAAAGDRGISRERLLALLWPESNTEQARNALRQTLYALRRDLGAPELLLGTS
ncbi:MAG: winged helix-turn-helix domain-containing protein, partial [Gemmatimonadaceae bacterium]